MRVKIRIKDLKLRAIIGIHDWERKTLQDVVINIEITYDGTDAVRTDRIEDTLDYKQITKRVIRDVEGSSYNLLDVLAYRILKGIMEEKRVLRAIVEVDKPHALRFAESVSITVSDSREE